MGAALGTVLSAGWASGINLYATVLLLGIFSRMDLIEEIPSAFENPVVIGIAAAMYLLEFVADKIPYVDSTWDIVHTAIRPVGGAVIGALLADQADISTLLGGLTGGGMALGSHATKASTRAAVNTSPEPVTNIMISLFEDGAVAGILVLATRYPELAGVLALVLLVVGLVVLVLAWKLVRAGIRRFRGWRARRRSASHLR